MIIMKGRRLEATERGKSKQRKGGGARTGRGVESNKVNGRSRERQCVEESGQRWERKREEDSV